MPKVCYCAPLCFAQLANISADDKIGPEGMLSFFIALDVDPLDIVTLIFAWKLKAKVPFEFSRVEFVDGCLALNCDSMDKLRRVIRTYTCAGVPVCSLLTMYDSVSGKSTEQSGGFSKALHVCIRLQQATRTAKPATRHCEATVPTNFEGSI